MVLLTVALFGVSSSGPLMAAATSVPSLAMSTWRTGLGAVALALPALAGRRAELLAISRGNLGRCLVAGLMLAGHFATWATSLKMTSVASATALVNLQVGFVVMIAWWMREPIGRRVWTGLLVSLSGVFVVSGVDLSISTRALAGDGLAIAGGAFGAVYIIVGSRVREQMTTTAYAAICYATSSVALVAIALVARVHLTGFGVKGWVIIVSVTVTAQIVGHSLINHLLAVMSPTLVSTAMLLEVPGAGMLAAVFLRQLPPLGTYAGLALICVGLALVIQARSSLPRTPVES